MRFWEDFCEVRELFRLSRLHNTTIENFTQTKHLFGKVGLLFVSDVNLEDSKVGERSLREGKVLCSCSVSAVFWVLWMERNCWNFEDHRGPGV